MLELTVKASCPVLRYFSSTGSMLLQVFEPNGRRPHELSKGSDGVQIFRIERNDPCPCGSGRKYKKCCLARVEEVGRILNQAAGPGVTASGRQILTALAFICGMKIEEEAVPPDPERVGRLLREVWEEEADALETGSDEVEEITGRLVRLLQEKEYLRDIRLPAELLYEMNEKSKTGEKGVDDFLAETPELLANDFRFFVEAVYCIAFSLRNDRYTDPELKTLLLGVGFLVDDACRHIFTAAVAVATALEIKEAQEKIKTIFEDAEGYNPEAELEFLDFVSQHPFYGEYLHGKLMEDSQPFLTAVKENKVKLVPPFYAVIQGFYAFVTKVLACLPAAVTKRVMGDSVFRFQWAAECLWENEEAEYFLPALLGVLADQVETAPEEELALAAEALLMAVKLSVFLDKPDLLEMLYTACLHGFISSLPAGTDITVTSIGDLLDEQFVARYAEWLKEQGKTKEGEYVWQQFQLLHKDASKQYAVAIDRLSELLNRGST